MRRLIVSGGIVALAAFATWIGAQHARFRIELSGHTTAMRVPGDGHVLILCDAQTPAVYAVARIGSTYTVRRLPLEWR